MKYGLLVYKQTYNFGDDIQSYAAKKFLPQIDYYIDRESLDSFVSQNNELVSVIMNGWFLHNHLNWPPSEFILPKLISMHFTNIHQCYDNFMVNNYVFENAGLEYLTRNGPVGCRDHYTLELLKNDSIDAYFSGCLTLCIDRFEDVEKQEYICLTDVPGAISDKISTVTRRPIKEMTHVLNFTKLSWDERFNKVEKILKVYQGAHCVITSRLHCALPCIALGTPVILIYDEQKKTTLDTYCDYLQVFSCESFLREGINYALESPRMNVPGLLSLRKKLEDECVSFITRYENSDISAPISVNEAEKFELRKDTYKRIIFDKHNIIQDLKNKNNKLTVILSLCIEMIRSYTENRKLVVWGTGAAGEQAAVFLERQSLFIEFFIDSDPGRENVCFMGKTIFLPSKIKSGRDAYFVIIASQYYSEISNELDKLGYSKNRDFVHMPF